MAPEGALLWILLQSDVRNPMQLHTYMSHEQGKCDSSVTVNAQAADCSHLQKVCVDPSGPRNQEEEVSRCGDGANVIHFMTGSSAKLRRVNHFVFHNICRRQPDNVCMLYIGCVVGPD